MERLHRRNHHWSVGAQQFGVQRHAMLAEWFALHLGTDPDFLDDGGATAQLFSVAISKGTDFAWHGAVDGLRINNTVYDFEEHGVVATPCASAPPSC